MKGNAAKKRKENKQTKTTTTTKPGAPYIRALRTKVNYFKAPFMKKVDRWSHKRFQFSSQVSCRPSSRPTKEGQCLSKSVRTGIAGLSDFTASSDTAGVWGSGLSLRDYRQGKTTGRAPGSRAWIRRVHLFLLFRRNVLAEV